MSFVEGMSLFLSGAYLAIATEWAKQGSLRKTGICLVVSVALLLVAGTIDYRERVAAAAKENKGS